MSRSPEKRGGITDWIWTSCSPPLRRHSSSRSVTDVCIAAFSVFITCTQVNTAQSRVFNIYTTILAELLDKAFHCKDGLLCFNSDTVSHNLHDRRTCSFYLTGLNGSLARPTSVQLLYLSGLPTANDRGWPDGPGFMPLNLTFSDTILVWVEYRTVQNGTK